jgi:hypothetical protein
MDERMFFDGWAGPLRVVIISTLDYLFLVLRVSGKRTLSKMNAFDLLVTVALGSTLATIILSKGRSPGRGGDGFCVACYPPILHHLALGAVGDCTAAGQGGADVTSLPGISRTGTVAAEPGAGG